jgi:hypothetical protein
MNTSTPLCPISTYIDTYNVNRRKQLNSLDFISFDVDENLRCGWMILLGEGFNVNLTFFLEYNRRLVLIKDEEDFLSIFKDNLIDLHEKSDGVVLFDCGVVNIKKDFYGNRWVVVSETCSWRDISVQKMNESCRVVLSEAQFYLLREVLSTRVKRVRSEMVSLCSTYNCVLRELVSQVRSNVRSNCNGCMRSGPGDIFTCGKTDACCLEAALHIVLQKKKIANRNKALDFVFENITHIFVSVARRIKEEMRCEENLLKYFAGGIPDYVKHFKITKIPKVENADMDYDY